MATQRNPLKANELTLPQVNYTMSMNVYPSKSHYKMGMKLGRVFPSTTTQAKYFLSQGVCLDVLNAKDVEHLEQFLNKYGFEGKYEYTKSKQFVRLNNHYDLYEAIKMEFIKK